MWKVPVSVFSGDSVSALQSMVSKISIQDAVYVYPVSEAYCNSVVTTHSSPKPNYLCPFSILLGHLEILSSETHLEVCVNACVFLNPRKLTWDLPPTSVTLSQTQTTASNSALCHSYPAEP